MRSSRPDTKPKPTDGAFLLYSPGNPEIWESFKNQYLSRTRAMFGRVYEELESQEPVRFAHNTDNDEVDDDTSTEDDEPNELPVFVPEDPPGPIEGETDEDRAQRMFVHTLKEETRKAEYEKLLEEEAQQKKKKITLKKKRARIANAIKMERLKLDLKAEEQLHLDRSRFIGDLLLHISFNSERHLREHEEFSVAENNPIHLWDLLRRIHLSPQHAGSISVWEARDKLMQCKQTGTTKIEDHARNFKQLYERLLIIGGEECGISDKVAAQMFLMSLKADPFGPELARWSREDMLPDNFEDTVRMVVDWFKTTQSATRALGRKSADTASEGAAFKVSQREGHKVQSKMCPICNKRSVHKIEDCWELKKLCQQQKQSESKPPGGFKPKKKPFKKGAKQEEVDTNRGETSGAAGGEADGSANEMSLSKPKPRKAWSVLTMRAIRRDQQRVFLDSGASISIWNSEDGVVNMRTIDPMFIEGVTGNSKITRVGTHKFFGEVYILDSCPINLLSLKSVKTFNLEYSGIYDSFKITNKGKTHYFDSNDEGLYELRQEYQDTGFHVAIDNPIISTEAADDPPEVTKNDSLTPPEEEMKDDEQGSDHIPGMNGGFDETVEIEDPLIDLSESMEVDREPIKPPAFTQRERERAEKVRELCRALGHPGDRGLVRMIKAGSCMNIPITEADVRRAVTILGPCSGCLRGKTTKSRAEHIPLSLTETVNGEMQLYDEQLHADLISIPGQKSKVIVFISVGERSRLVVASKLKDKTSSSVNNAWGEHFQAYAGSGAVIRKVYTDNEATLGNTAHYLSERVPPVTLIQHGSEMHEPYVERRVRTVKERMRSVLSELPFQLPGRLYYPLMIWVIQGINITPDTLTTPDDMRSAREIISGLKPDLALISKASFGQFVQYHVTSSDNCNLGSRNEIGIIVGRFIRNGNFRIWDINSKQYVVRRTFIPISTTSILVNEINAVAESDSNPDPEIMVKLTNKDSIAFKRRESYKDMSDSDDSEYIPNDDESEEDDDDDDFASDDGMDTSEAVAIPNVESTTPEVAPRYSFRERRGLVFTAFLTRVVFTQLTVRDALEQYGSVAKEAMLEEFTKMRTMNVFHPIAPGLAPAGVKVIPSSIFVKVKYKSSGEFDKVRARMVAGGHKQEWNELDSCSSPTASWEAVLTFLATCAQHDLHIMSGDVPSAYLHASREGLKDIYMKIGREMTHVTIEKYPELRKFVNPDGTMTVLISKAMYGLKESGLLWNNHIKATLEGLGFKQLQQELCMFVKEEGLRVTSVIVIYVDDLLIAAKDRMEAVSVFNTLETRYGVLSRNEGPEFSFLGTTILVDRHKGTITLDCKGFIQKLCSTFSITSSSNTPHPSDFGLKREGDEDTFDDNHSYRSLVMSLLYVAKRVRPDILFTVSHLTTRQVSPTKGDWKIANKVLKYLYGTPSYGISFKRNGRRNIEMYADAAFNTHADSKSHSGVIIFLASGPVHFKSSKQKLVTKSSTEAELVAFDEALDMTMWIAEICEEIGYGVQGSLIMYQDNQSAIHILKQGRMAKKRGTIGVRFDFILEQLQRRVISLAHVSSQNMKADILTKALHGDQFSQATAGLMA